MSALQPIRSVPSGQDVVLLTAPVLVGSLLNCLLFGTLMLQVYLYSISYQRDKVGIKVLVYSVFILDVIQTFLGTHAAWGFLISGWGDPGILTQPPWSVMTITLTSALISAIAQTFFAWRIWSLKKTRLARGISVLIVVIALMQMTTAIVGSIRFTIIGKISAFHTLAPGFLTAISGNLVADILVAGCQLVILFEARSKSPYKRTESLVTKLIVHTVQTAAVTAITSLVNLIFFAVMPYNFLFGIPTYITGKLYSNVLLANLNARSSETRPAPTNSIGMVQITTEVTADQYGSSDNWTKSPGINYRARSPV